MEQRERETERAPLLKKEKKERKAKSAKRSALLVGRKKGRDWELRKMSKGEKKMKTKKALPHLSVYKYLLVMSGLNAQAHKACRNISFLSCV